MKLLRIDCLTAKVKNIFNYEHELFEKRNTQLKTQSSPKQDFKCKFRMTNFRFS